MKPKLYGGLLVLFIIIMTVFKGDSSDDIVFSNGTESLACNVSQKEEILFDENFVLEEGQYQITITYEADEAGNVIRLLNHEMEIENVELNCQENLESISVEIEEATAEFSIQIVYTGKGSLSIQAVTLHSDTPWHCDNWIKVALFVGVLLYFMILGNLFRKQKVTKQRAEDLFLVMGMVILSSSFLLSGYMNGVTDDLNYHLTRIEGIAAGLREGQFPVMVYPDILQGRGYTNVMYPSLFLYFPAVLRLLGVSFVVAYKMFVFAINCATAFVMYAAMQSFTKSRRIVLLATAFYIFSNYRINNILIRGAVGETLAMIFLPLLLAGTYEFIRGRKDKWWMIVIAATGVIQSHVLSVGIYAVIVILFLLVFVKELWTKQKWCELLKIAGMILLLNAGFLVPFALYMVAGNLSLSALDWYPFWKFALNPGYLFGLLNLQDQADEAGFVRDFALHLPLLCMIGITFFYYFFYGHERKKNQKERFLFTMFLIAVLLLWMATSWFPYSSLKDITVFRRGFSFLQFPWRLLGPASCMLIVVGCVAFEQIKELEKYKNTITVALFILILLNATFFPMEWNENMYEYDNAEKSAYAMEKTNADFIFCPQEYMVVSTEETKTVGTFLVSGEGVQVTQYSQKGTKINFTYQTQEQDTWIELPLQAYLGYVAYSEDGQKYTIQVSETGMIRVLLPAEQKQHTVFVSFQEPVVFRIAELLSVLAVLGWAIVVIKQRCGSRR